MTEYLGKGFSIREPAWESPPDTQREQDTHREICENTQNNGNDSKSTTPNVRIQTFFKHQSVCVLCVISDFPPFKS